MRWFFFAVVFIAVTPLAAQAQGKPQGKLQDVPLSELNATFRLIGKLGEPLGTVITVQGVVVEGPFKGYEGGPNLRVQRISGKATQEDIQIHLSPYFGEFEKGFEGKTCELEGYETGTFVGVPAEAYRRANIVLATTGFYFRHSLVVYKVKQIKPIAWSPADFVDREALLEGKALSRDGQSYIEGHAWKLLTNSAAPWPKEIEGKTVEALGTVKKFGEGDYRLDKGNTRLVKLEDQLGRPVELRGRAWSLNDHWWFEYRGTDLYVEDLENLPGWKEAGLRGQPILITGVLDEAELPALDQIAVKPDRDLKKYFIVRKAAWKSIDTLFSPERVGR